MAKRTGILYDSAVDFWNAKNVAKAVYHRLIIPIFDAIRRGLPPFIIQYVVVCRGVLVSFEVKVGGRPNWLDDDLSKIMGEGTTPLSTVMLARSEVVRFMVDDSMELLELPSEGTDYEFILTFNSDEMFYRTQATQGGAFKLVSVQRQSLGIDIPNGGRSSLETDINGVYAVGHYPETNEQIITFLEFKEEGND